MITAWQSRYIVPEPSIAESLLRSTLLQIETSLGRHDYSSAKCAVFEWANSVSHRLGLQPAQTYKYFKRNLVERWFGPVERKRFAPGWTVDDICRYAAAFTGHQMRMSFFQNDTACHSESVRIPVELTASERSQFISQFDTSLAVEVFPESSGPQTICFRRFSTAFGETVFYEAARGQAMNAFEAEQGQHPVVSAIRTANGYEFKPAAVPICERPLEIGISESLSALVCRYDSSFELKTFSLCRTLGIDYCSVEGYFSESADRFVMVDLDLPLDRAFLH